jgi:ammonia channel protein AmtB
MRIEMVSGFLLPAGVWLIVSSGLPMQAQRRLASATFMALAITLLCYAAFGFALMYGGIGATVPELSTVLNAPVAIRGAQDIWIFAGATGFLLDTTAQPAALSLFIGALPLVLAGAVLLAGALVQRARSVIQLVLIVLACGVALPIAGCWLWANGWLSVLGASDAGRLAVVGLVAGGAGLAWLRSIPRRAPAAHPELPTAHLPARALAGVLLVLAGMAGILMPLDPEAALRQFVNTSIAVAVAIIAAGAYTAFTTRTPDTLSASRAMLAAIFMSSAGAATLPTWMMAAMGAGCGLLATVGFYWVNEKRLLDDESAMVTAVLLPSAAGMLIAGLFAGPAMLIAQAIAVAAMAALAYAPARALLGLASALRWPTQATPLATPAERPDRAATPAVAPAPVAPAIDAPLEAEAPFAQDAPDLPAPQKAGLFDRLRKSPPAAQAEKPARKVAYPYRFGGRRVPTRPIASDASPADGATSADAS